MKIVTLIEDTSVSPAMTCEHGLSQYIETEKHRILFDTGKSGKMADNAIALRVDLKQVDTLVLSHGHDDHWGGIMTFAGINRRADIYMNRLAASDRWNKKKGMISFDRDILDLPKLHLIDGDLEIDSELFIFSSVYGQRLLFPGKPFYVIREGKIVPDDFAHEQNLVVTQENKRYLFAGCAHKGIINIMDRFTEIFGCDPDYVFGGFHLYKKNEPYTDEETAIVKEIAEALAGRKTCYYTGHCTGEAAFAIMKEILGERLQSIASGSIVIPM